jgi:hypothetical protein
MHIGLMTDGLPTLPFEELLRRRPGISESAGIPHRRHGPARPGHLSQHRAYRGGPDEPHRH